MSIISTILLHANSVSMIIAQLQSVFYYTWELHVLFYLFANSVFMIISQLSPLQVRRKQMTLFQSFISRMLCSFCSSLGSVSALLTASTSFSRVADGRVCQLRVVICSAVRCAMLDLYLREGISLFSNVSLQFKYPSVVCSRNQV